MYIIRLEKVHKLQLQEKEYMERLKRKKAEEQAKQEVRNYVLDNAHSIIIIFKTEQKET